MTKIRKAVLMHSPATGPWFYVGTRAYYWGLSASLSNSNKKIPPRPPPPGFVSAFTLVHAICCWRQISSASGARAEAKMYLDLGKYLAGHSCVGHSGLGRQGESWHCPTTHPTAPSGWHSSKSHLQVQPGSGPSSTNTLPWEENLGEWRSEEPFLSLGTAQQGRRDVGPCHPTESSTPQPDLPAAAPGQAGSPGLTRLTPHTGGGKGACERSHHNR